MAFFICMVRLEGFEPPTLWFVARYSIQLSYKRIEARNIGMSPLLVNKKLRFLLGF